MPIKVKWLEGNDVPMNFVRLGHTRVFRVISHDGLVTDLLSGAEAAKLAFELQERESLSPGIPGEHS